MYGMSLHLSFENNRLTESNINQEFFIDTVSPSYLSIYPSILPIHPSIHPHGNKPVDSVMD